MEYHPGFQTLSSNPPAVPSISMLPINIKAPWKHTAVVCCLYLNTWMCGIPSPKINVPADPVDGNLTTGARDRHYQALNLCHSETMDEQTNFTQACIRSDSYKCPRQGSTRTTQDERYLQTETERVKEQGVENRKKADIHAAYTPHFLFLQLLELSVPQHSQRKKNKIYTRLPDTLPETHY